MPLHIGKVYVWARDPTPQLRRSDPVAVDLDAVTSGFRLHSDVEFHALRLLNRREPVPVHFHDLDHLRAHAEFEFLHFIY